jgi:ATP-dependent Zn protease
MAKTNKAEQRKPASKGKKSKLAKNAGQDKKRKAVAFHEAGHAVIYWARNRRFRYVTIKPGEKSLGHVRGFTRTFKGGWVHVDALLCTLAGNAAEKHFTGRSNNSGSRGDFVTAIDYARGVDGQGGFRENDPLPQSIVKGALKQLEEVIVAWWWPAITAVAEALFERETLTEDEVKFICNSDSVRENLRKVQKAISEERER